MSKNEYNVFISYSWKATDYKTLLIDELEKINGVKIFSDHLNISLGDLLWSKISEGLDYCYSIITILDENALQSLEVRDELARANDRGKLIIPIIEREEADAKRQTITPHFLRQTLGLYFTKNKFNEILPKIKSKIEEERDNFLKSKGSKENLLENFSRLRKLIVNKSDSPDFCRLLTTAIISSAIKEITKISHQDYDVDLGREHDFLLRAGPLFASSNQIYAVTLSWVSNFWIDENNINNAIDYLKQQGKNTIRLFVFKNPSELKN